MNGINSAEIAIRTLNKYTALLERAATLERETLTIKHQVEMDKLRAELAAAKEEISTLWLKVFKLEQEAKEREAIK